jgi:hypothetical protein
MQTSQCPRCMGTISFQVELGGERDVFCIRCGWRETRQPTEQEIIDTELNTRGRGVHYAHMRGMGQPVGLGVPYAYRSTRADLPMDDMLTHRRQPYVTHYVNPRSI